MAKKEYTRNIFYLNICVLFLFIPIIPIHADIDSIHTRITDVDWDVLQDNVYYEEEGYCFFLFNFSAEVWNGEYTKQDVWVDAMKPGCELTYFVENSSLEVYIYSMYNFPISEDAAENQIEPGLTNKTNSEIVYVNVENITSLPDGWYYFQYNAAIGITGDRYGVNITINEGESDVVFDNVPENWAIRTKGVADISIIGIVSILAITTIIRKIRK